MLLLLLREQIGQFYRPYFSLGALTGDSAILDQRYAPYLSCVVSSIHGTLTKPRYDCTLTFTLRTSELIRSRQRINGRALIARDEALLERSAVLGKKPKLVLGVEVQECFFHCAKAFRRSKLWDVAQWPERSSVATLGTVLKDQLKMEQATATQIDCDLEESYAKTMY